MISGPESTAIRHSAPSDQGDWPPNRVGWYAVILLSLTYILSYVDRTIIILLVQPMKRDLNLSDTGVSLLLGFAFSVFYAIAGLPLGRLADRANRKLIVTFGTISWSGMTMLCTTAHSFGLLFLARVGVGVGEASLHPSAISLIADYFPEKRRGRAMGAYMASGTFGAGAAFFIGAAAIAMTNMLPAVVSTPIGNIFAWQFSFLAVGTPGILLAIIIGLTLREPRRRGLMTPARSDGHVISIRDVLAFMSKRRVTYIAVFGGISLANFGVLGAQAWMPTAFMRLYGWTATQAGLAIGISVMVFGAPGALLATNAVDWLSRRGRQDAIIIVGITFALGGMAFLIAAMLTHDGIRAIILFAPSICLLTGMNVLGPLTTQLTAPNEMRAQIVSIYFFIVNIIGFALGPSAVALLTDHLFRNEMALNSSIALVCAVVTIPALVLLSSGRASLIDSMTEARVWRGS